MDIELFLDKNYQKCFSILFNRLLAPITHNVSKCKMSNIHWTADFYGIFSEKSPFGWSGNKIIDFNQVSPNFILRGVVKPVPELCAEDQHKKRRFDIWIFLTNHLFIFYQAELAYHNDPLKQLVMKCCNCVIIQFK